MFATISADIVSSTALSIEETRRLKPMTTELFELVQKKCPDFWGRLVKGDYIECLTQDVAHSFRIALIIKCYLKSYVSTDKSSEGKTSTYGARIAIGIGDMRIVDREHDLMDGEAIYLSGRALSALGDATKGSLTVATGDASLTEALQTVAMLTDVLVNNLTQRQSEVVLYKLLGENEQSIADTLNITQAAVNTHASRAKWYSIKQAVNYFEQINFTEHES
jgi:hypothetical protein